MADVFFLNTKKPCFFKTTQAKQVFFETKGIKAKKHGDSKMKGFQHMTKNIPPPSDDQNLIKV